MTARCEICDGTNLVKDMSGNFICQDCGAAYSVDAMRLMLTGEIIEDTDKTGKDDVSEPDTLLTVEAKLEREIISSYEAGNYQHARKLLNSFFRQGKLGVGDYSSINSNDIPYAIFLGSLSSALCKLEKGSSSEGGVISSSYKFFVDNVIENVIANGKSGSEAIAAISEMHTVATSTCVAYAEKFVTTARQQKERRLANPYDTDAILEYTDASVAAESFLNANRECVESTIMGFARICALGMDVDDEFISVISTAVDICEDETVVIPHVSSAIRFLSESMNSTSPFGCRLFPEDMSDAGALVRCGEALWNSQDFGLATMAFGYAHKIDENDEIAWYYLRLFRILNDLAHSAVLYESRIEELKELAEERMSLILALPANSSLPIIIQTCNDFGIAVSTYAKCMVALAKKHLSEGRYGAGDELTAAELLNGLAPWFSARSLAYAATAIEGGAEATADLYASLKSMGDIAQESDEDKSESEQALLLIKDSYAKTRGINDDGGTLRRQVDNCRSEMISAKDSIDKAEKERAALGIFDRKAKKELDVRIASLTDNLKKRERALGKAQQLLDIYNEQVDTLWAGL